ncbi:MAG: hypothetical protein K2Q18_05985 [Bdellovibrionales bacterium]|nr:hypothetical protein [Bdellovibrionales bacterium]
MKFSQCKTLILSLVLTLFCLRAYAFDLDIIVNEKNTLTSITVSELQNYFTKKSRTWPNGDAVRFFDQRDDNESRKLFLSKFIKKTPREVELYWIGEKIYTGNIAPIQISSDSMMVSMVSRFPGGIGYVDSKATLKKTVKKITVKPDLVESQGNNK